MDKQFVTTLGATVVLVAVATVGCTTSADSKGTTANSPAATGNSTSTAVRSPTPPSVSSSVTTTAPSTPVTGMDLTGTWTGQYRGAYSGTFTLSWQQSGSSLSGRITLSAPASTVRLNGTLKGTSITFGTVGSAAITYSGTVSGNSMSGVFQVGGAPSGNWNASKSS